MKKLKKVKPTKEKILKEKLEDLERNVSYWKDVAVNRNEVIDKKNHEIISLEERINYYEQSIRGKNIEIERLTDIIRWHIKPDTAKKDNTTKPLFDTLPSASSFLKEGLVPRPFRPF